MPASRQGLSFESTNVRREEVGTLSLAYVLNRMLYSVHKLPKLERNLFRVQSHGGPLLPLSGRLAACAISLTQTRASGRGQSLSGAGWELDDTRRDGMLRPRSVDPIPMEGLRRWIVKQTIFTDRAVEEFVTQCLSQWADSAELDGNPLATLCFHNG